MIVNLFAIALTIYLIYVFGMAGYTKFSNNSESVNAFNMIGKVGDMSPEQFRKVTGGIELLAVVFLVIPPLVSFGATLIFCVMVGAIITHIKVFKGGWQYPAKLLIASLILAILRW